MSFRSFNQKRTQHHRPAHFRLSMMEYFPSQNTNNTASRPHTILYISTAHPTLADVNRQAQHSTPPPLSSSILSTY